MEVRIKFREYGTMKLIGHLGIMRYFQRAVRRADVNACYSGEFSPHQIMSFAAPLEVGVTNNGEYVDIEVTSTKDSETMKGCLDEMMSKDFEIVNYRILLDDAANAVSIVEAGDCTLAFRPGYESKDMDKEQWFQGLIAFFERPSAMVTEQTKRGEKKTDLEPLVYGLSICPEGNGEVEGPRLFMKISMGSAANVKPEQVLDAYYGFPGRERPPFAFMIQREEVCTDRASKTEKEAGIHSFISLEQLGEKIR